MKLIPVLILIIVPRFLFAKPSLEISLFYDKGQNTSNKPFQVRIYKNNSLLYDLKFSFLTDTTFQNLELGSYRIEYLTIFKRWISQTVEISRDSAYWEFLTFDTYDPVKDTFNGFINSLQEGKNLELSFEQSGCFHWEIQNIRIALRGDKYIATLSREKLVRENKKRGKAITKVLTKQDINYFKELEDLILDAHPGGGSTETTKYTFTVNGVAWAFQLDEGSRKSFYKLKKIVFKSK